MSKPLKLLLLLSTTPASMGDLCFDLGLHTSQGETATVKLTRLIGKLRRQIRIVVDDRGVRVADEDWQKAIRIGEAAAAKEK